MNRPNTSQRPLVGAAVALLITVAVLWVARPWVHWVVMAVYTTPELLVALVVGGAITAYGFTHNTPLLGYGGLAAAALLVITLPIVGGLYADHTLGQQTIAGAETRDTLPDVDTDHPRILPRATADRYAANSLQTSQYHAAGSDITVHNNTTYWAYALAPDGTRNTFLEQQSGTVLVNMETQSKDVEVVRGEMEYGVGMSITDNYRWQLLKHGPYLVTYQEAFMVVHESEQYIAVPYTQPQFHARALPIPTPYTTPQWGGVALIDSDGNIEHLSPDEARQHPVLENQRLAPFELTRQKVAATSLRNGILNVMPVIGAHDEQIEVAPVPGENNDQPFYTRTTEGAKYVVAVEPYGDTQGVREVWVADARTHAFEVYQTPDGDTLLGPRKAADYVRQAARTTDWNRFTPSEPLPVVVDDTLYWQLRVVPTDASGISYVAYVNAETSDVTGVETTAEIRQFFQGNTDAGTVTTNETSGRTPQFIVEKRNASGAVVATMEVYGNETVTISNATANTTEAPA